MTRLGELQREREDKIREWRELRRSFLKEIDTRIGLELLRMKRAGNSVSQICEEFGTKNRATVTDYLKLAETAVQRSDKLAETAVQAQWGELVTVTRTSKGNVRVDVVDVPEYLWTQETVPVDDGYTGWIEYSPDGKLVIDSSERISPLHAETGIRTFIAQETV